MILPSKGTGNRSVQTYDDSVAGAARVPIDTTLSSTHLVDLVASSSSQVGDIDTTSTSGKRLSDVSTTRRITSENVMKSLEELGENDIGKWCVVLYDSKPYPGIIIDVDRIDWSIEVKVMHNIGTNRYFWPTAEDRLWYNHDQFVTLIAEPIPVGTRHCQIEPVMWKCISQKLEG